VLARPSLYVSWLRPPRPGRSRRPFPQIAGSASSLLAFCQFVVASTAALVVGLTLDGTTRPMALAIAVASLGAFASLRIAHHEGTLVSR
jgi:hypothetical protein